MPASSGPNKSRAQSGLSGVSSFSFGFRGPSWKASGDATRDSDYPGSIFDLTQEVEDFYA
jgi:hypothetical protein